jgi:hypothetical protein
MLLVLAVLAFQSPVHAVVRLDELELASGTILPSYGYEPPWRAWNADGTSEPWAVLEGEGEVVYHDNSAESGDSAQGLGALAIRCASARDVSGTLFLPKANGEGFLRLAFRVPAARATAGADEFRRAELELYRRRLRHRLPGAAWFRHRFDALAAELGLTATPPDPEMWQPSDFRPDADALGLFTGGRALYENLQLERGLPTSPASEENVPLESLEGVTVKAIDWMPHLAPGETTLDPLAALVPADQHALFFPSFPSFTAVLDEAENVGAFALAAFESRSSDARTRERTERQLGLELGALARTFGPLAIDSVALTGSDPYLRTGSDVLLLFRAKSPEVVEAYVAARQAELAGETRSGRIGTLAYRGVVDATRSRSSYLARLGEVVAVSNSLVPLERLAAVAAGTTPALATTGEYRFFRQRYARGSAGESALLIVPDEAIRRWCSPRWRIASARLARAAAELADLHVRYGEELLAGVSASRALGEDAEFPRLGALRLFAGGVHSSAFGSLEFMTPIAELPLARVSEREAQLYRTWREGYESAWSNFFDPIGARLSIDAQRTTLDLTVMPLILGTEYDELREVSRGAPLPPSSGDAHADTLAHFVLRIDPEWEEFRSFGSMLGSAAQSLGADPLSWLGEWVALYADEGPFWDDLLEADDVDEALDGLESELNRMPIALAIAVRDPLKLALFMTSLRAFVDGTAPGLTRWKERVVGERRFVEISSDGLGSPFSLFYATTPTMLVLSLHEPTLLAAMEREALRRGGTAPTPAVWDGAHAGLALGRRGLALLALLSEHELAGRLRRDSWRNLPILNEWRKLRPELDPLDAHARVFGERLTCPGGGTYTWNAEWHTFESSVFGHPGAPKPGVRRPLAWDAFAGARFALEFEEDGLDGLRVRAELERE